MWLSAPPWARLGQRSACSSACTAAARRWQGEPVRFVMPADYLEGSLDRAVSWEPPAGVHRHLEDGRCGPHPDEDPLTVANS
eukprot:2592365-Prymnesium_polylepis.1